jgi:hypothetical protein
MSSAGVLAQSPFLTRWLGRARTGSAASAVAANSAKRREEDGSTATEFSRRIRVGATYFVGFYAIACPVLGYALSPRWGRESAAIAIGAALIGLVFACVGALLGFVFAIPRELQSAHIDPESTTGRYIANTNLEQISDWLTKVIVGVSLVQIGNLPSALDRLGHRLSPLLGSPDANADMAIVLALTPALAGFLLTYLYTRVIITLLFAATGRDIEEYSKRTATEVAVKTAQAAVEEKVKQVVGDKLPDNTPLVDTIVESVRSEVAKSAVTIDFTPFDRMLAPVSVPLSNNTTVYELLNYIFSALPDSVSAYTYGEEWQLRRPRDGKVFQNMGTQWARAQGLSADDRPLTELGIESGDLLEVIPGAAPRMRKPRGSFTAA